MRSVQKGSFRPTTGQFRPKKPHRKFQRLFGQLLDRSNVDTDVQAALRPGGRLNIDIDSRSPVFVRRAFGPAPERMPGRRLRR
jgi:hypothetical protein